MKSARQNMVALLLLFLFVSAKNTTIQHSKYQNRVFKVWSGEVKDSFIIYVSNFTNSAQKPTRAVYYLDAKLNSGYYVREELAKLTHPDLNTWYIGIAHMGDYHVKRRRDFIPPKDGSGSGDPNFGHGETFYTYLTKKLIPLIEKKYQIKPRNHLVGHSLGGLFAVYALTKNESFFTTYYSLSPSIWINYYAIIKRIENQKAKYGSAKTLVLMNGNLEYYNKISQGNAVLRRTLSTHQKELKLITRIYPLKGHNGYVKDAIKWIINQ